MRALTRSVLLAAFIAAAPACRAQVFFATLSGLNESPPNNSPGIGTAIVTLDTAANTMRVQVSFSGLLGTTTASHIHAATPAPLTGTAGVATTLPTFPSFPLGVTSGTYDQTFDMLLASSYNPAFITANGGTPATAEAALFAAIEDRRAYLNIHTTVVPGGEIRGFLVPEPGALSLLGGAAVPGLLGVLRLRRRRRAATR